MLDKTSCFAPCRGTLPLPEVNEELVISPFHSPFWAFPWKMITYTCALIIHCLRKWQLCLILPPPQISFPWDLSYYFFIFTEDLLLEVHFKCFAIVTFSQVSYHYFIIIPVHAPSCFHRSSQHLPVGGNQFWNSLLSSSKNLSTSAPKRCASGTGQVPLRSSPALPLHS